MVKRLTRISAAASLAAARPTAVRPVVKCLTRLTGGQKRLAGGHTVCPVVKLFDRWSNRLTGGQTGRKRGKPAARRLTARPARRRARGSRSGGRGQLVKGVGTVEKGRNGQKGV